MKSKLMFHAKMEHQLFLKRETKRNSKNMRFNMIINYTYEQLPSTQKQEILLTELITEQKMLHT